MVRILPDVEPVQLPEQPPHSLIHVPAHPEHAADVTVPEQSPIHVERQELAHAAHEDAEDTFSIFRAFDVTVPTQESVQVSPHEAAQPAHETEVTAAVDAAQLSLHRPSQPEQAPA